MNGLAEGRRGTFFSRGMCRSQDGEEETDDLEDVDGDK